MTGARGAPSGAPAALAIGAGSFLRLAVLDRIPVPLCFPGGAPAFRTRIIERADGWGGEREIVVAERR